MTDASKGTFIPFNEVLPNPSEPEWEMPADVAAREALDEPNEQLGSLSDTKGNREEDHVHMALLTIKKVLDGSIGRLNLEGAELFKASNYAEALKKAEQGDILAKFRYRAMDLYKDWLLVAKDLQCKKIDLSEKTKSTPRQSKSVAKLTVSFSDGEIIFENTAAATFSKAISKMGVERVEGLGIHRLKHPLVSLTPPEKKYTYTTVGQHYLITHFSNEDKRRLLLQIAEQLSISIQAELTD